MDMRRRAAAALVAVVVAAGLGACGNEQGGGSKTDAGGRPLLPAVLGGGGAGAAADAVTAEAAGGGADRSMLAGAAPIEYRVADGAEAPAKEAPAYRFVPEHDDDAEAKLAKVLGADGRTATLEVRHGTWYFSSNDAGEVGIAATDECKILPDGSCEQKPFPPPPPGVPTDDEAEARLGRILDQLGVDAASGRFSVAEAGEPVYQRVVSFEPAVDGLPLRDLTTTIGFGGDGRIEFANGYLGTFEKVGDYPLVGLGEALERHQRGFVGGDARTATGTGVAEPAIDPAPAAGTPVAVASDSGSSTPGSTVSSGSGSSDRAGGSGGAGQTEPGSAGSTDVAPVPPEEVPAPGLPSPTPGPVDPVVVEVTGAELVLTPVHPRCEGDDLFLVPSFALQPDEVGFAVPAVEDSSVADPADSEQTTQPCPGEPRPDEPVGRPEPAPMPPDAGGREPAGP